MTEAFQFLETANKVVGKSSAHLLEIELSSRVLLSSTLDLVLNVMREAGIRNGS